MTMESNRISYHDSARIVYERLKRDGMSNVWDRYEAQGLGGDPIPDLPVAVAAPEYMEQKATIDALFALALGLYTYVNPVPTVTGGPDLAKLLTEDLRWITGGVLRVETDAGAAVDGIAGHIEGRRKILGL